ncbi:hypothetical protein BV25DRAFT_1840024 [Artomyces pyxidatus]|uniref:Uncharacterized protein n=1 Tax=Artomyces pyxidatus TaxID=48021 RepID=A0ACB8SV30_9AGAM|nr:hypothetical protein BV25DRAFT_1840024 [Artomyces pyxidatus]
MLKRRLPEDFELADRPPARRRNDFGRAGERSSCECSLGNLLPVLVQATSRLGTDPISNNSPVYSTERALCSCCAKAGRLGIYRLLRGEEQENFCRTVLQPNNLRYAVPEGSVVATGLGGPLQNMERREMSADCRASVLDDIRSRQLGTSNTNLGASDREGSSSSTTRRGPGHVEDREERTGMRRFGVTVSLVRQLGRQAAGSMELRMFVAKI